MVSLEKNDHLMLARQLPLKSVALILAGGRGTRLKDLTNKRAKPAVHFGGKFRIEKAFHHLLQSFFIHNQTPYL